MIVLTVSFLGLGWVWFVAVDGEVGLCGFFGGCKMFGGYG